MAPPAPIAGRPGLYQTDFTGKVEQVPGVALDAGAINSVRQTTISNEQVKGAQTALANWQAMTTNASQMTGPAAMGMVDSMVRAYSGLGARQMNVNALMATFGIPAQLQGAFQKAFEGKGPLTVPMRQELLDAAYSFVQSHYAQGAQIVQGQRNFVQQQGGDPKALDGVLPQCRRISTYRLLRPQRM